MKVCIEKLTKTFGNQMVLNIDYVEIDKGLTCVMGRNGCGKTTLLNILSGQLDSDGGIMTFDGQPYSKDLANHMTLVQQKPMLFARSVEENIAYPLKVRKVLRKDISRRVDDMLSLLDIEDLRHKKGTELSGGECQKVAIARALIFRPKLLMLDEPTSNIDSHSREMIEQAVKGHGDQGNTVIWVTHDKAQAMQMAERIIELPVVSGTPIYTRNLADV